jgi:hypothetical protein
MNHQRRGLCRHSPDLLARDDTIMQVTRILQTFVGTAVVCARFLLTPDSALPEHPTLAAVDHLS